MREIKFRAWDEKLGYMIYPDSYYADLGKITKSFTKITKKGMDGKFVCDDYSESDVLMQFTGLKDKNGKEIYEGDILKVKSRNKKIAVGMGVKPFEGEDRWSEWQESFVEVYTEPAMWLCRYTGTHGYGGHLVTINAHAKESGGDLEIIGNIYENSDLIK